MSALTTAEADVYVDSVFSTTNFDGLPLQFEVRWLPDDSGPTPLFCPEINRQIYMRFNLSAVDFSIAKARLSLRAIIPRPLPPVTMQVMAAEDAWNETTMVWGTQPRVVFGPMTDYGDVTATGFATWTDDATEPAILLAEWLETQRAANGGDDQATLTFTLPLVLGCFPGPFDELPQVAVTGQDRLGRFPPLLALASAEADLPPLPGNTQITLASQGTQPPVPAAYTAVWTAVGLLAALSTPLILRRQTH